MNPRDFAEYVFGWQVQDFQDQWYRAVRKHEYTLIYAAVEHGKSSSISQAFPAWCIGRDPSVRIALISNSGGQAEKFFGVVRELIEGDTEEAVRYRRVFPNVRRGRGKYRAWGPQAIIVDRPNISPDYTMCAIGVGKKFLGARFDIVIFDDILDFDNTATEGQRDKIWRWMNSTALTRVVKGGKAIFICTAWHLDDAAHRAENSGEWVTMRTPAISTLPNGEPNWFEKKIAWPDSWPIERLRKKYRLVGSAEFARQFLCTAISDSLSWFKEAAFQHALERGKEFKITEQYGCNPDEDLMVVGGLDVSVKNREDNDVASLFIMALYPNGDRRLLTIREGHMTGMDIINLLIKAKMDFPKIRIIKVEDNAAQDYLLQFAPYVVKDHEKLPPLSGFTTTQEKHDPDYGIPSIAAEMDRGMWIFPSAEKHPDQLGSTHPVVQSLIMALRSWSPREHTTDKVMAMYFAREAACSGPIDVKTAGERDSKKKEFKKALGGSHERPHLSGGWT